jgi:hypothetical protein
MLSEISNFLYFSHFLSVNLNLFVRKFIMPNGSWIWSSLSESSLCPTVHLSEALSVRKFNMPDGPWIGSCWSESLLCQTVREFVAVGQKVYYVTFWPRASDPWTVWHNKLSDQELQIHQPSDIINFLTKSFRSMNRESLLCQTVHEFVALGQKVYYVRRLMDLKLLVRKFIMSDGMNFLTKSFRSIDRRT